MRAIKIGIVGDGDSGKTSILIGFTSDVFYDGYVPTVFDNFAKNLVVDDQPITLRLCDTAGQEEYKKTRPEAYPNTDVFLICFSLVKVQCSKTEFIVLLRNTLPCDPCTSKRMNSL